MDTQEMDIQKSDLLEVWKGLQSTDRESALAYMRVLVEMKNPDHQKRHAAKEEEFRMKMAKVRCFKDQLEAVTKDARTQLYKSLQNKSARGILADFELLRFFEFVAEYRPLYLFEEAGVAMKLAERAAKRLTGQLKQISGKPS